MPAVGRSQSLIAGCRVTAGAALALACLVASAVAAEPKSVLLIYGDPRQAPAVARMDETLRATIGAGWPAPVRFYSEYLDLAWFPKAQERAIAGALRHKYGGARFDVVVACGESALRFALRERRALFPGVPMVFCTVEDARLQDVRLPRDVTGVTTFRDWGAGLDLILRLHPSTRRIVFVSGAGPVERGWEALARQTFARYEGRLAFTYLGGRPIAEVVAAVTALDEGSVVVFNVLLLDGDGRPFSSPEALALVAPAARVPIYGTADTQLGHGIVGGLLVSYEAQARKAGELALRVLDGERLGPADIVHRLPNAYMFDGRQLDRWRIRESVVPAGSVVRFREPSIWSEYKWRALATLAVVIAQSLLVAGLLIERRQRRRVRARLDERLRFETLLADLAAACVEVPVQEIDARIGHGLDRIIEELDLDRAGLGEFGGGFDELRVTHVRAREGIVAIPGVFARAAWPWSLERLARSQAVCFSRLAELPEEAATDRSAYMALGTKSIVMVPVVANGAVMGALGCSMVRHEREWPEELVQRLRLLADTFAVVLMRRRADSAIEESEGRFRLMADASPVMIWVSGADGLCIDFNRAWLRFTGRTLGQELGEGWLDGVHPDDREACRRGYLDALAVRRAFTLGYRLRRADGVYRDVIDNGTPRFDADGTFQGYVGSAVDITDVKAAQQTELKSLALRSAIFGSLYGLLAAVDRSGVIVAVNEAWMRALDDHGGAAGTAGVGVNYLAVCRRAAATGDQGAKAALEALEIVLEGRIERAFLEYACPGPEGERWYTMIVETFRRPEGGLVIAHIDVTRRRRAEEEVQREREDLAHALRVATLGELATSLAHEINQPLAAIASNAQAAQRLVASTAAASEIPEMLHDITADAQRAAQVIRRLRVLFKKEHSERQPVDIVEVIKEVLSLLRKELERRRVELEVALPPAVPRVLGDIVQLQQVVLNVLINAGEAMTEAAAPRRLRVALAAHEPGLLALAIRDSGVGVPAAELEHIFDRFVTSKPEGLGMGLSISRSIIEAHGGRIWATRNPDRGLTLHVEVPCLEG
jgi:two-component system, LuxR family, sensor kinase FixL